MSSESVGKRRCSVRDGRRSHRSRAVRRSNPRYAARLRDLARRLQLSPDYVASSGLEGLAIGQRRGLCSAGTPGRSRPPGVPSRRQGLVSHDFPEAMGEASPQNSGYGCCLIVRGG